MLKKVRTLMTAGVTAGAVAASASVASAGTPPFFVPLTESAPVTAANSDEEMNQPWITPANITQENLTSMDEIEGDIGQSVVRVPGVGRSASMWDMVAFDPRGRYVFIPHETPFGAGVSRYDMRRDETVTLFAGDQGGAEGDWTADYAAFDPSTFTPNKTLLLAEEWSGEGRVLEVLTPFASPAGIRCGSSRASPTSPMRACASAPTARRSTSSTSGAPARSTSS